MIHKNTFTKEWIQKKSADNKRERKNWEAYFRGFTNRGKYNLTDVERYDKKIDLKDLVITNTDFNKFKSIMKFDPEAYFYWYKSIEIISRKYAEETI